MKRLLALLCVAICLAARGAAPAAPPSVFLEEMTWTEVRDAIAAGRTTVIVPVGGTEQNGPHMALGKHNVRAQVLAGRIATQLGNALVAPVVSYVPEGRIEPAAGHMQFAGTISISDDAFKAVLDGAARSLRHAGFRDVVLIGDHGGYQGDLAAVAARLDREWAAGPTRVHFIAEYYRASADDYAQLLRERGITAAQIGSHAGTADTSLALAVDARLVRADRLGRAPTAGDGLAGDPRPATAALGQLGVDLIVARSVAAIRRAVGR
ncbi:MAG: creatininase family protein [Pseudomonadota bacterium]|nr:creatininase family protein [Pseudomonadota bacterium]